MNDYKELVSRLNRQYTISQFAYVEQLYDAMNAERKLAAEAIERLSAELDDMEVSKQEWREVAERYKAELAALKSASAEPLCWVLNRDIEYDGTTHGLTTINVCPANVQDWSPLYLHPAPAAVQEEWKAVLLQARGALTCYDFAHGLPQAAVDAIDALLAAAPKPPVQEDAKDAALLSCVKDLTEIVRMPNAEWVADAHNAAVRKLRAAMKESNHVKP